MQNFSPMANIPEAKTKGTMEREEEGWGNEEGERKGKSEVVGRRVGRRRRVQVWCEEKGELEGERRRGGKQRG